MSKETKNNIFEWVKTVAISVVFAFLIIQFIKPSLVMGESMYSTLEDQDFLIINRMSYKFGKIGHGDIIVFKSHIKNEDGSDKDLVKRVIGVEGDKIKIQDGEVYVNDEKLDEPYIHNEKTEGNTNTVVPKDCVFVLGDNREISFDSRYKEVGFIKESDIEGKVVVRLYPFNKMGTIK